MSSYDFRASASYNTTIKEDHIINGYGGMEVNSQDRVNRWSDGYGIGTDSVIRALLDYSLFTNQG